ncbi:MAG: hypothetical protein QM733_23875 [Ilumatobacteraceae bacterium]
MLPLRFAPHHQLGDTPNVVVDGSPVASTVLTLSHWPGSPTPVEVRDDLSVQSALHALDHPDWFAGVDVVSNNHFDQDGLAAAFALIDTDGARRHRDLVIDLAAAGDFATFTSRDGARLAMAIAAFADQSRSPLGPAVFAGSYAEQCSRLYVELLDRLPGLLADVDSCRALWADEDADLTGSLAAIADGSVHIEEHPGVDLAVVTIPERRSAGALAHRFAHVVGRDWTEIVHPMAVNTSTAMLRVLLVHGRRYRLELRYETWVMLTSRPVMPRPDLRPVAARLTELEPSGAVWHADPPGALTPFLQLTDGAESGLDPPALVSTLVDLLAAAPPAWDPFEGT